ncbi:MAG: hypothetical protein ACOCWI_01380, partial [Bacillota bacterium]
MYNKSKKKGIHIQYESGIEWKKKEFKVNIKDHINKNQKTDNKAFDTPEEAMDNYSKMSEEELMQELFKVGACSRGGVSPEELDDFYNNIKSMLSPEQ